MRPRFVSLLVAGIVLISTQPLNAAPANPAEKRREADFWWNSYMPTPVVKERSPEERRYKANYSDVLGARLGVVDGKARLFRVDLDGSTKAGRAIEGNLDGNGVKVRFKW